jgi:hypothetical protein
MLHRLHKLSRNLYKALRDTRCSILVASGTQGSACQAFGQFKVFLSPIFSAPGQESTKPASTSISPIAVGPRCRDADSSPTQELKSGYQYEYHVDDLTEYEVLIAKGETVTGWKQGVSESHNPVILSES